MLTLPLCPCSGPKLTVGTLRVAGKPLVLSGGRALAFANSTLGGEVLMITGQFFGTNKAVTSGAHAPLLACLICAFKLGALQ